MKNHFFKVLTAVVAISSLSCAFSQSKADGKTETVYMEFGGKKYEIRLSDTSAAEQFVSLLPLNSENAGEMVKFGGFEYYTVLPLKISDTDKRTEKYKAGHVYYNIQYTALSLVFADQNISPSQAVEIGTFTDTKITGILREGKSREKINFTK
ncbi:cyclophilin-like fold protein [Treponema sp.]|uniref:cyclophilin-like fold protein n=1 Tax=Treponema sp. TaxID=166 RepID=UPI003F0EA351